MPREPWFVLFLYEKYAPASGPARVRRRRCGRHSEIRSQAFSAVLDQVVSMRDRERARDGSVNVLSLRTLRVFSDHKQETDSSTKGLVCLPRNQVQDKGCESSRLLLSRVCSMCALPFTRSLTTLLPHTTN